MNTTPRTRREFLGQVGQGALMATLGCGLAREMGLASACAEEAPPALNFGVLEPLVCLMQETPVNQILPKLTEALHSGTDLRTLVAAAALANSRTCGGEDYVGYHTLMAIGPAYYMSEQMPDAQKALPVFKVLYRNSNLLQRRGGRKDEVLRVVQPSPDTHPTGEALRDATRRKDVDAAERIFAAMAAGSPDDAFNELLCEVDDDAEVHRVVLPYRAYDLLGIVGREHAYTLLRNSVRYCVKAEQNWARRNVRDLLPKVLEEHKLLDRTLGDRKMDDAWVESFSKTLFTSSTEQAAHAAAAALADGVAPADLGQAISLAANELLLRDRGRPVQGEEIGKLVGSVHGNSIGLHACDSANAWRNMARIGNARNACACLVLGAYQVALDRIGGEMVEYRGDFQNWTPLPTEFHMNSIKTTDPKVILGFAEDAIRNNLQAHACACLARYGQLGLEPRDAFDLLLRYAVSEDGALHAEKFYQTSYEEFKSTRPAFRWRYLAACARVTASEHGTPAPGVAEARELLKI